jgi:hypothetical protein
MKRGKPFSEGKLSAACADQKVNRHTSCSMQTCICCCHLSASELARIKGLRTVPKPGDPDFKEREDAKSS